jgi:hypothetical protein
MENSEVDLRFKAAEKYRREKQKENAYDFMR